MFNRKNTLHLIVNGLPAHKNVVVKGYVAGILTWRFTPDP